ncbi:MAG: hypothetical protein M1838_001647 [Thelocarpon superellum]|nr:MAG: hypothetical protein M1838_001647 [Thelocarpon superellum]
MAGQHTIVILGGSFGGISVAHYLLRHTIPALTTLSSPPTYKVIMVSTSTSLYWNICAPRALVSAALIPVQKPFIPVAEAFSNYPAGSFEFLHAEAVDLDVDSRIVSLKPLGSSPDAPETLSYDTLIIATGASSTTPLWSASAGHEKTIAAIESMHAALPTASKILVAGAGPVGVETTGELAAEFGTSKSITLVSASPRLLGRARPALGQGAERMLKGMGVTILYDVRMTKSEPTSTGQTLVHLSNDTTTTVDVLIDATGLKPNTGFVPARLLDDRGAIITNAQTLRVTGARQRVYALGPVSSYCNGAVLDVWDAMSALMANVAFDLSGGNLGKEKSYARRAETLIVPVGRSKGVGVAYGWPLPSLAVWVAKGRSYMLETLKGERDGQKFVRPV